MNENNIIIVLVVSFFVCFGAGIAKEWNIFNGSLFVFVISALALGYRLLGGT